LTEVAFVDQPPPAVRFEAGVMQPLANFRDPHLPLVLAREVHGDGDQINVNAHASVHDIPRFPPSFRMCDGHRQGRRQRGSLDPHSRA
jgi:hypothetical protein